MAGYAATARIAHAAPRRVAHDSRPAPGPARAALEELPPIEDMSGRPFAADLVDLLADIGEVFQQAMRVLHDPQGWR